MFLSLALFYLIRHLLRYVYVKEAHLKTLKRMRPLRMQLARTRKKAPNKRETLANMRWFMKQTTRVLWKLASANLNRWLNNNYFTVSNAISFAKSTTWKSKTNETRSFISVCCPMLGHKQFVFFSQPYSDLYNKLFTRRGTEWNEVRNWPATQKRALIGRKQEEAHCCFHHQTKKLNRSQRLNCCRLEDS